MAFIWIGSLVSVLGWLFLALGVGLDSNSSVLTRSLVDVHRLTIASNVIYLGYFLILVGLVLNLQKRFVALNSIKEPQVEFTVEGQSNQDTRALEQAFKDTFSKTATIRPPGSVRIDTDGKNLEFKDADEAWEYCIDHFYTGRAPSPQ